MPAASAQVICPPGTYASRNRCVKGNPPAPERTKRAPAAAPVVETTLSCAQFNAKFTSFHQSYAQKFGKQAFRQDQSAAQLRQLIDSQQRLVKELRTQAMYARDIRVRRHLMSQSKEAQAVMLQKQKDLAQLQESNKRQQQQWKSNYHALARRLLGQRPKSCQVAAAK
ncbi:MAG: hypothetical protein ABIJ96_17230 [Elusimicrobiota bacterium]